MKTGVTSIRRRFGVLAATGLLLGLVTAGSAQVPGGDAAAKPAPADERLEIRTQPLFEECSPGTGESGPGRAGAAAGGNSVARLLAACSPEGVPLLIEALRDPDLAVRMAAIEALGKLRHPDAIDPLVELAADPDWRIRAVLTRTLASYQVYRASNTLLNIIVNPGDKRIITEAGDLRSRCIGLLMVNQLRDVRFSRKAIGFLFGFLDYEQPELRRMAEEAAAGLKETRNGYHELIAIVKQHNVPDFRLKAVTLLGQWRKEEAREALTEAAANDRSPVVRKAAAEALALIGVK